MEVQPKPKKKKNYLNNADMLAELKRCHEQGKLTEEMGRMFLSLVTRYASIPRFSGYSYNEDMRSLALLTLTEKWSKFNMDYSNPFAYYTQIVHNAFHQLDNSERRQRDIRDALLVDYGRNPSFSYEERYNSGSDNSHDLGDGDYMESYDNEDPAMEISKDVEEIVSEIEDKIVESDAPKTEE